MPTLAARPPRHAAQELPPTANTERTQPENRAFLPALDGLRALAFLMVFGQHYLTLAWGWTGVSIFFVLSGFLITGILFDTRDDPFRVRNFYLRRSLRIFPLYYGLFLLLLLLTPLLHWNWNRYWIFWPLYLGNVMRFFSPASLHTGSAVNLASDAHLTSLRLPRLQLYLGHFWSLCVEEQFYLLWPWAVFQLRDRKKLIAVCSTFVVLIPVLRFVLNRIAAPWLLQESFLYGFTLTQSDALLLGGLCALLWRGPERQWLQHAARALALLGTVVALSYLLIVARSWQSVAYPSWTFTGGLVFVDWYAAALIVCALTPGSLVYRLFHVRPLRWIGRLSYGAYLFHDLLHVPYTLIAAHLGGDFLRHHPARWQMATAALALPCTLLLAWLSFRYFESPFLNLKARWTLRPLRPLQGPAAQMLPAAT